MASQATTDEEQLLKLVPENGDPIGNTKLRRDLAWDDAKFWSVRDNLIKRQTLVLGRGRGGSVRLNAQAIESEQARHADVSPDSNIVARRPEKLLYPQVEKELREQWSKSLNLE